MRLVNDFSVHMRQDNCVILYLNTTPIHMTMMAGLTSLPPPYEVINSRALYLSTLRKRSAHIFRKKGAHQTVSLPLELSKRTLRQLLDEWRVATCQATWLLCATNKDTALRNSRRLLIIKSVYA